jgi:hypothetical protein
MLKCIAYTLQVMMSGHWSAVCSVPTRLIESEEFALKCLVWVYKFISQIEESPCFNVNAALGYSICMPRC